MNALASERRNGHDRINPRRHRYPWLDTADVVLAPLDVVRVRIAVDDLERLIGPCSNVVNRRLVGSDEAGLSPDVVCPVDECGAAVDAESVDRRASKLDAAIAG